MSNKSPIRRDRGVTLVELMISMTITIVIVALVVQALVAFDRDQAYRTKISSLQGSARLALEWLQADVRQAGLGVGDQGAIWMANGAGSVSRPAIQIFANIGGGGTLADAKPGTDALLLVEAFDTATRAVTIGQLDATNWTQIIPLNSAAGFATGDAVLMSNSYQSSWGVISAIVADQLTFQDTVNVLPPAIGTQAGQPVVKLAAGSPVRRARARLYYVDTSDELVRLTLAVPRAPTAADILAREVLAPCPPATASGMSASCFENMKINCETDNGVAVVPGPCPGTPVSAGDPVTTESVATFGGFLAGGGPLFSTTGSGADVSQVRGLTVSVSVRSRAVDQNQSDAPVALTGAVGPVTLGSTSLQYARRTYRIGAAVRNLSLGSL